MPDRRVVPAPSSEQPDALSVVPTTRGAWVVRRWHRRDRAWAFVAGLFATRAEAEAEVSRREQA